MKGYFFEKMEKCLKENTLDDLVPLKGLHTDIKTLYGFSIEEL
jgi:hypothetical protein